MGQGDNARRVQIALKSVINAVPLRFHLTIGILARPSSLHLFF
ncbi:fructose-1,6-bisphosphatase [Kingella kingae ATCC 23330]|uniref:Fructose-1,6-bisphosphatase n=1 Tax=Kingella kingae ATCC 23330 TaxID=887327 RepID=F5S9Y0_KINKI|nr:fructose-1,6-bisphosphatase [Kingella kingae ATCC 23330]